MFQGNPRRRDFDLLLNSSVLYMKFEDGKFRSKTYRFEQDLR